MKEGKRAKNIDTSIQAPVRFTSGSVLRYRICSHSDEQKHSNLSRSPFTVQPFTKLSENIPSHYAGGVLADSRYTYRDYTNSLHPVLHLMDPTVRSMRTPLVQETTRNLLAT